MSLKTQARRAKEAAFKRALRDLDHFNAIQMATVRAEAAAMSEGF